MFKSKPRSKEDKKSKEHKKSKKRKERSEAVDADADADTAARSPTKKRKSKHSSKNTAPAIEDDVSESPFHLQTISLYLPLSPVAMRNPVTGLCAEHLSPLLLTYYPPLRGTILSYDNVRVSESPLAPPAPSNAAPSPALARSVDEYAVCMIWVTADVLIFRPRKGVRLTGAVNLHSQSHLSLLCFNLFNVSIPAARLPREWTWVGGDDGRTPEPEPELQTHTPPPSAQGDGKNAARKMAAGDGFWVDADGKRVDGMITFTVRDFEAAAGSGTDREKSYIGLKGTMLSPEDDEAVDQKDAERGTRGLRNGQLASRPRR
ncbi:hypothetical protein EJ05DRAFT_500240 [Pseudovirgaria hyperparasitica]|uniref:DNA-directed RNA polymerase subunit n=1 Tax=Pseudovirgaria hyperparasitica TaxID=470096 RepID=A0A6A6WC82_9PEZI|nr:uncharacterized protein EJ05DRAFT_500240 [Pseudovirgaria hyperparasitica]KAF2758721.1 hypothetical protein EJ05DRAFT_500240 [Pseudovirgaria hyperparasitica]